MALRSLVYQIKRIPTLFQGIEFTHIFKEVNKEANGLSNKGQWIEVRIMILKEPMDGLLSMSSQYVF